MPTTFMENGPENSTQHDEHEESSQYDIIPPIDEGLLGKRKKESNFISRIELGLKLNNAKDPRPKKIPIQNEAEQVNDDIHDANTATSKPKGKGKRGIYKSYVIAMKIKGKGSKLRVTIPDDIDRAIGENARHLVNECGRVVRTRAPFNVKNWFQAFEAAGECMLKEIQVILVLVLLLVFFVKYEV